MHSRFKVILSWAAGLSAQLFFRSHSGAHRADSGTRVGEWPLYDGDNWSKAKEKDDVDASDLSGTRLLSDA
jgi:hypothetical protein